MQDALPTIVVVLFVLIGVLVGVVTYRRKKKLLGELTEEQRQLHEQCVAADRAVRAAEAEHKKGIREAEKELKRAENPEPLAKVGTNSVTPIEVIMNGHRHPLSRDVTATIDQTGDITAYATQRSTLTRVVGGGVLFGPAGAIVGGVAKKSKHHQVDTRELYLMVLGPDWQEVAKLDPTKGEQARSVMQAINTAAQTSRQAREDHERTVKEAKDTLARVQEDTSKVDAAKATRAALGPDPYIERKEARKGHGSTAAGRTAVEPLVEDPRGTLLIGDADHGETPQDAR